MPILQLAVVHGLRARSLSFFSEKTNATIAKIELPIVAFIGELPISGFTRENSHLCMDFLALPTEVHCTATLN
jgi:hypothetical protein